MKRKLECDVPYIPYKHTIPPISYWSVKGKYIYIKNVLTTSAIKESYSLDKDRIIDISLINNQGDVEHEVHRVTGQCFYGIISTYNNCKKTYYVYDSTMNRIQEAVDSMIEEVDKSNIQARNEYNKTINEESFFDSFII